jgi:hypothetical protein
MATILVHLADMFDDKNDPDPDITAIRADLPELRGTLEFALEVQAANPSADYWTLVSLAELHVLASNSLQRVVRAYRKAITASRRSAFFLESSIQQLEILQALEMRPEYVSAGIEVLKEELARIHKEEYSDDRDTGVDVAKRVHISRVFLFTGYRLASGSECGCFPTDKEALIVLAIKQKLDKYNAGPGDLAITTGMAAGGDLLFIEDCAMRGITVETYMPVAEPTYVRDFVSPAGDSWVERFYRIRNHPQVDEHYQFDFVGNPKRGDDVYERNNRWALYSAMAHGVDNLKLIALFDYEQGICQDTKDVQMIKHMIDLVRDAGGQVEFINPAKISPPSLDGGPAKKRAGIEKKEKLQVKEKM